MFGTALFGTFHFEKVTEHFRGQFQFSACRPTSVSPTPHWLSLFTQLHYSDRTAGCPTPAAQQQLKDLWLSSDHLHSTFHLWFCVCVSVHTRTAGLHSGSSNCYSMHFACGCDKSSHSLWPSFRASLDTCICPFSCIKVSTVSNPNPKQKPVTNLCVIPSCISVR